ncbi:MAG: N-acetyltransferase [Gemmatimonadaceae bacterium]|nr:N-acetyltransferase [Gemmatimonadaceae bacterium]
MSPSPAASPAVRVRPSTDADVEAIADIYAYHVLNGTASFELAAPSIDEMRQRREEVLSRGLPYLVAEVDAHVVGYAYANLYRPRPAYRHSWENSIYVHHTFTGRGIGRVLLHELIDVCTARGARQLIAVIGDSANVASIQLHAACGFTHAGTLHAVGYKFDRWIDSVFMQRALG